MRDQKNRVLVTGGAGFVGHHLVNDLLKNNFEVNIIDDLSTGKEQRVNKKAVFFKGDIRDKNILSQSIKDCSYIVHLAARVDLQRSIKDPSDCFSVNVMGTSNIIEEAIRHSIKKIVFASTCAVYPMTVDGPITEDCETKGNTPYALSKRTCERMFEFYFENFDINFAALRCFNIYGIGQNTDSLYSAVIPTFIKNAKNGSPLELNNGGIQTRDFISVNDVSNAIIKMLKSNCTGIFNLGSGIETSIESLANMIISIENKSSTIKLPAKKGDALRSFADIGKISKEVEFKTNKTLANFLKEIYNFY